MYAGSADGTQLPAYVVYKAVNMHDLWTIGGPKGARYNRTPSGWFDMATFTDWFKKIALPYFRKLEGKKVLIGDNLSSHLSVSVIEECEKHEICFVFLPANSSHLTQPLDVSYFRPMKIAWREILLKWKKTEGRKKATVPKDTFPTLLRKLEEKLFQNSASNLKAGFVKTGIYPINRQKILDRLPKLPTLEPADQSQLKDMDDSIVALLNEMRYDGADQPPKRKKKLSVPPGKSGKGVYLQSSSESSSSSADYEPEGEMDCEKTLSQTKSPSGPSPLASGVSDVGGTEIKVGAWLLVNFSVDGETKRKRNLYLGKVFEVVNLTEFEALFVRPTFRSSGSTFSFPQLEDRSAFNVSQVIGAVEEPEEMRRGILKFKVNSTEW